MSEQIICSFALPLISQNNSAAAKYLFTNTNWEKQTPGFELGCVWKNASFKTQPLRLEQISIM